MRERPPRRLKSNIQPSMRRRADAAPSANRAQGNITGVLFPILDRPGIGITASARRTLHVASAGRSPDALALNAALGTVALALAAAIGGTLDRKLAQPILGHRLAADGVIAHCTLLGDVILDPILDAGISRYLALQGPELAAVLALELHIGLAVDARRVLALAALVVILGDFLGAFEPSLLEALRLGGLVVAARFVGIGAGAGALTDIAITLFLGAAGAGTEFADCLIGAATRRFGRRLFVASLFVFAFGFVAFALIFAFGGFGRLLLGVLAFGGLVLFRLYAVVKLFVARFRVRIVVCHLSLQPVT